MSTSERRKRRSKWDQITPDTGVTEPQSSQDASVSAAAAAARLNAMLEAQGKLDRQLPSSLAKNTSSFSSNSIAQASSLPTGIEGAATLVEIEINDSEARGTLTKGPILNDINKATGAFISVRGRYMLPEERNNSLSLDKPLHLHIQGPNAAFVNAAVQRIRVIMNEADNPRSVVQPHPSPLMLPNIFTNQSNAAAAGHHYLQDKVFIGIGIDDAPDDFKLLEKLQGPGGTFLGHIASTTGAKVFLRGKGSGYLEPTSGRESFEALYVYLSHPKSEGLSAARKLCESLIGHVKQEFSSYQRSQMYGGQPPVYQPSPTGFNPYYQNPYGHSPQGPPVPLSVPPGYAPPPVAIPHPQQPPLPTPLMLAPQPPIINGGGYYDGGGYLPLPGFGGPPPPPVIHGAGPVPAGPVPSFPPPPLVGPEKPFAPEFVSEPVYPNDPHHATPVYPNDPHHATPVYPNDPHHAPPPHNLPPNISPNDSSLQRVEIENLAYHQLPRNRPVNNNADTASSTKRKFTEKSTNVPHGTVSTTNVPHGTTTKSTTTRRFIESIASNPLHTSTKPSTEVVKASFTSSTPDTVRNVANSKLSQEIENDKKRSMHSDVMPPPSFNPRVPSMPPRINKRPSVNQMQTNTPEKKSKPASALSLVSYGDDSDSD